LVCQHPCSASNFIEEKTLLQLVNASFDKAVQLLFH
jgi:hypothetical protein